MMIAKRGKSNSLTIANEVQIRVVEVRNGIVRLSIEAPNGVCVRLERTGLDPAPDRAGTFSIQTLSLESCK